MSQEIKIDPSKVIKTQPRMVKENFPKEKITDEDLCVIKNIRLWLKTRKDLYNKITLKKK
jgi:hypothetical protein